MKHPSSIPTLALTALILSGSPEAVMSQTVTPKVRLGDEVLFEEPQYRKLIEGKRVGLITNPTGMDSRFVSTIDKLHNHPGTKLTALFAPEHGLRGAQGAGESVASGLDPITKVPVYSLHGTGPDGKPLRKPLPRWLENVDVLVYDIQDIGNRSYTYVGTMELCMEAAREKGIPFVVLDRPNPMGGDFVDGNILEPEIQSLVGWAPVPYLYGMTPGEMARWMNDNSLTTIGQQANVPIQCDLTVVPMKGWKRSMRWWDTGLPWIPTSTHMQHPQTCWFIAITGTFGELHAVNEGVGYPAPFEYVGAPWIKGDELARELNSRNLPGLYFRPAQYRPYYGTYENQMCGGVQVMILDYARVRPVEASMHILEALHKLYPDEDVLRGQSRRKAEMSRVQMFNKVMGTAKVREALLAGKTAAEIVESWKPARDKWVQESRKYLLYE